MEGSPIERPDIEATDVDAILESSSEAIFRQDAGGAITRWNRATQRLLGRADEAILGADLLECLCPEDRALWHGLQAVVSAGERIESLYLRLRRSDGQIMDVSLTATPTFAADGSVSGTWIVARDLTEQFLAQRTLAEGEQRVRRGELMTGTGNFTVDAAAGAQWSAGMYTIFGVAPGEFLPSLDTHLALVHRDDREAVRSALEGALSSSRASELDHRVVRPDGTLGWVFLSVEPVHDRAGRVIGARGVCQDVTQRKQAEISKEIFLATVSHELRTPLSAVLGFSDMLQSKAPEYAPLIEPIVRNSQEMRHMIERLLDHSRLEASRVRVVPRPLPLAEAVRKVLVQLEHALEGRLVKVAIRDDVMVNADPDALERILVNLVGNAAKYSAPPAPIVVSAEAARGATVVSVRDRGPGIAQEDQMYVFDRFYRAAEHHVGIRGTGIGLAIVKQYVELHGGTAWVESVPGEGATFRVSLPDAPGAGVAEDRVLDRAARP